MRTIFEYLLSKSNAKQHNEINGINGIVEYINKGYVDMMPDGMLDMIKENEDDDRFKKLISIICGLLENEFIPTTLYNSGKYYDCIDKKIKKIDNSLKLLVFRKSITLHSVYVFIYDFPNKIATMVDCSKTRIQIKEATGLTLKTLAKLLNHDVSLTEIVNATEITPDVSELIDSEIGKILA